MAKRGVEDFTPTPAQLEAADKFKPSTYNLPKKRLSNSQVEMYLRCPRQYYFRYVRDEKRPPGIAMILGTGAHAALEFTHHHIVDSGAPASNEFVMDAFSASFDKGVPNIPKADWEKEETTPGAIKDVGVRLVSLYNQKIAPQVKPQVIGEGKEQVRGIEKEFTVDIEGIPVLGFIDLIDTNDTSLVSAEELKLFQDQGKEIPAVMRTSVIDFKTKAKSLSQADVDNALQLTLYSYAEKIPSVRFDQLLNQKVPKLKQMSSIRQASDHAWLKYVVKGVARAISAGVFPPCNPSEWCCSLKWCGFFGLCRGKKV